MYQFSILLLLALAGYLIGATPFGYLVARWHGVDIFQHGSGNIGATNVGRVLGKRWGIIVFLLDFLKGAIPTATGNVVGTTFSVEPPVAAAVTAGMAAFIGHLFPIYLRFRGGKGVATGAGVVSVLLPGPTAAALFAWIVVVVVSRYVSLASLAAAGVLSVVYFAQTSAPFDSQHLILSLFCVLAAALVVVKHRANVGRLLRGNENRLPDSSFMRLLTKVVHVLAVGLWFGMAVFFSFPVALSLFGSFEALAEQDLRPTWFPLPEAFKLELGMQKDQGTRAAGFAVSPLFDFYFLIQGVCGLIASVTALSWTKLEPGRRVHGLRAWILLLALITVLLGWPIERKVSELREVRNVAADRLLKGQTAERAQWQQANSDFAAWHLWSLLLNIVTIGLVTGAMAMTAALPEHKNQH